MLNFRGMLKTTVDNGTETFRFEDKVFETGGVDSYIMTPDVSDVDHKNQGIKVNKIEFDVENRRDGEISVSLERFVVKRSGSLQIDRNISQV